MVRVEESRMSETKERELSAFVIRLSFRSQN
jgi:hypothetical protein